MIGIKGIRTPAQDDLDDSYRDTPGNHLGKVEKGGISRQTCNSPMQGQKPGEVTENGIKRHQRESSFNWKAGG